MNKVIIYCLSLMLYLILSKSLSPFEFGISYVNQEDQLAKLIKGSPVSAVLTDIHTTGFAIKTYYMKFKIIYGFESYEELIIRCSNQFSEKYSPYLGLSIFRRTKDGSESFTPLIPGAIFIGDRNYGSWRNENETKVWHFYRAYRQIPIYLGWNDYKPTIDDYNLIQVSLEQNKTYPGVEGLFGPEGVITKKSFPDFYNRKNQKVLTWREFLKNYFNENFINYKEQL